MSWKHEGLAIALINDAGCVDWPVLLLASNVVDEKGVVRTTVCVRHRKVEWIG